jgi:peroxiredoxin/uncharacterized membrane protein YphA (DoxX/SURF4 family)
MKYHFDFKKIDRNIVSLVAIIIIGLTFLVSGTGKIFGLEEVPAQVVGFINAIIPAFILTPGTVFFLYHILIPYLFPWAELILGLLILIGFMPRLIAVLCLPLLASFLGTNIWSIVQGSYNTCADCFGIWEQIFGALTPVQSLVYDIVLFCCALIVIFFYPGKFLSSRQWLSEFILNNKPKMIKIRDSFVHYIHPRNFANKIFQEKPRNTLFIAFCVIGAILIIFGVIVVTNTAHTLRTEAGNASAQISNLAVSDITENSAVISWTTDEYTVTSIQIYDAENAYIRIWTDPAENTVHMITIDQLKPDTIYYFRILTNGIPDYREILTTSYFKTMPVDTGKPVINDIRVNYLNEQDVSITWSTSKPATSEIEYWITDSNSHSQEIDPVLTTAHRIQLTMLDPDATYNYIVKSTDAEDNQVISEDVYTFSLSVGPEIGKRAPDFSLQAINGGTVTLSDYSGKCVMLNFWMVSCPGCRHELPIIEEAFKKLPPDQTMILDIHTGGREDIVASFVESEKLAVPVLHDPDRTVTNLYSVTGVPTTFFIDSSGIIQMIDRQFTTSEELVGIFMTLLNK